MTAQTARPSVFRRFLRSTTALVGAVPMLALSASLAHALPQDGKVVQGTAKIIVKQNKVIVIEKSPTVTIDWSSFNIAAGEKVVFVQKGNTAQALNQVLGPGSSQIYGSIFANGMVIITNANGIYLAPSAVVKTGGFIASAPGISQANFTNGVLRFDGPTNPGAQVINQGTISVADGGLAALVAPSMRNSGIIQARLGKVALVGAKGVTIDLYGDNLILFQATDQIKEAVTASDGKPAPSLIQNDGKIYADGGTIILTANAAKGVVDQAINMTGIARARAVQRQGGDIVLSGGEGGSVQVSGTLDASGQGAGQTGGRVTVSGDVLALNSGAKVDTSGDSGGGKIVVGSWQATSATVADGATLDASAKTSGNGGSISVISATTNAAGIFLARGGQNGGNGGQVETSGHFLRVGNATVNTSAPRGKTGNWLLDPTDFTIAASGGDMTAATLVNDLANSNVTILSTSGGTSGSGDINVNQAVTWNSPNSLTLSAYHSVLENSLITPLGTGSVTVNLNQGGSGGVFSIGGQQYTLITQPSELQNMSLTGRYALNGNIDLTNFSFTPIGYTGGGNPTFFSGTLDGQGHTVSHLVLNDSSLEFLGLFSGISGTVRNIGVTNANVSSSFSCGSNCNGNNAWVMGAGPNGYFGILSGDLAGSGIVSNTYTTGSISDSGTGSNAIGGLIGRVYVGGTITNSYSSATVSSTDSKVIDYSLPIRFSPTPTRC